MKTYYFILGALASAFYDATTGLSVSSKDKKKPEEYKGKISKRIATALKHGHIVEVDPDEVEEEDEKEITPKSLGDLNDAELVKHYQDSFEVTKSDVTAFKKLSREEKLKFLTEGGESEE